MKAAITLLARSLMCSAALISCGAPARLAVPEGMEADIPGIPEARFPGDRVTPRMKDWLLSGIRREEARLHEREIDILPETSYLALSGGGAHGAFGAGLLCGWTERGDRPVFHVVTGISTGALIAPFAFAGPDYDPVLREVYTSLRTADVAAERSLVGALLSDALMDSAPLRALIARHVTSAFLRKVAEEYRKGRGLVLGTTNLDSQRPVIWAMGAIAASGHPEALQLFRDVMLASASIPGIFPPVRICVESGGRRYEELHVDGGTASQVFLYPAGFSLKRFSKEEGVERKRSVYVVRNAKLGPEYEVVERKTLPIAARALSTLVKTQGVGDLYRIYLGCLRDDLDYRLAYIPEDFDRVPREMFDPEHMKALFDLGFRMARSESPWAVAPPGFEPPRPHDR